MGGQGCLQPRLRLFSRLLSSPSSQVDGEPSSMTPTRHFHHATIMLLSVGLFSKAPTQAPATPQLPQGGCCQPTPSLREGLHHIVAHDRVHLRRRCRGHNAALQGDGGYSVRLFPHRHSHHFTHPPPIEHSVDTCVHPPLTKVLLGFDPVPRTVGAAQSVILNALRPYP